MIGNDVYRGYGAHILLICSMVTASKRLGLRPEMVVGLYVAQVVEAVDEVVQAARDFG